MPEKLSPQDDMEENKEIAASSYFLVFAPVLLITRKDSPFVQFHSAQATVLLIAFIIFWILGDYFFLFDWCNFVVLLAAVIGFIQSIHKKKYALPVAGEIAKHGLSPRKIAQGFTRIFKVIGRVFIGVFPKETGEKINEHLKVNPDAEILRRLDNIEKVLLQDKFFIPSHSLPLQELAPEWKNYFTEIFTILKKQDPMMRIHSEKTFYEVSGNFGTFIIGGIKKNHPKHFSYAIASSIIKSPENSLPFGAFMVGRSAIGSDFLWKQFIPKDQSK
jgi:uncharacterized membrane protein